MAFLLVPFFHSTAAFQRFLTFLVFAPSLSVHMPNHFLSPSKTARKNVKNSVEFLRFDPENLEIGGIFFELGPENLVSLYVIVVLEKICTLISGQ